MRGPVVFLLITLKCLVSPVFVFAQNTDEYIIKAVWLEKLTRFIEWPDNGNTAVFTIGIIGDDPFEGKLDKIYQSQTIQGKQVLIQYIRSVDEIKNQKILFISSSEKGKLDDIIEKTRSRSILTVGDTKGFSEHGVLVNFFMADNKIKFEVNETQLKQSPLKVSYQLLNYARIINPVKRTR